jgi:type I restriction enzyme S subunit
MSVEKNVPDIRFKGFSGEWEEKTLGGYTTFRRGSFPQPYGNKEWYGGEGSMPFVQVVDVSKDLSLVEDTKQKISLKAQPRSVFVPKGSVVVTLQGTIGRVAVTQYDSFVDRTVLIFESFSKKTDSSFWAYTIQNKFDLEKKRAPGGTIKTITKDALSSFDVLIPSTEEQTIIGNTFQKLDSLINQHQQKHDKLSNIKKAMLEKMFPKQGENIPEIRFKGFGGEWVVKELSQVSDKITEKNTSLVYSETFTNSAEFGIISQRDYFDNDISNSNNIGGYYVVQPEDFVYNPRISTFAPCGPINRNALGRAGVMSPLYSVFRTKGVNTIFIEYFFQTKLWHAFMFFNGDTGARADRFSIKDSVFFELPLRLPTVNEQIAIGNYFQKLDALISQHQQQIIKLNNIKQACLSKMFV